MLKVNLMTTEEMRAYHELITKTTDNTAEVTKEDIYTLNKLTKLARLNSIKSILTNLVNNNTEETEEHKSIVNILEYENMPSMYRIQVLINGKYKTVARIKASTKDIHIAIRENTAQALDRKYHIVNYNLPAQYHIDYNEAYKHLREIIEYHYNEQIA